MGTQEPIEVVTFRPGVTGEESIRFYERHGFEMVDPHYLHHGRLRSLMRRPPDEAPDEGGSFHRRYARYAAWLDEANCPVCRDEPEPPGYVTIADLPSAWLGASREAQGRLWGKCELLARTHYEELHTMPSEALSAFMVDLQRAGAALTAVSGAVRINYEVHGNTMPHLHAHLFPRYVDDPFPGMPIDYRITRPSPYHDEGEFEFFVEAMREQLEGGATPRRSS